MERRVIITGADGFIGSKTVETFLEAGWHVLALDANEVPRRLVEHPHLKYVCWDMLSENWSSLFEHWPRAKEEEYSCFIHFAWAGSAGPERKDLLLQMKNVYATDKCVRLAKAFGCKTFVGAGSLMEYEVESAAHYDGPLTSINHYGMAKLAAHYSAKQKAAEEGIDFVWAIITNVYGPGETAPRFINNTIKRILAGEELTFNSNGFQNYDFVYIDDAAFAFYLLAQYGVSNREYVISSGKARPLYLFVDAITKVCKGPTPCFNLMNKVDCALPIQIFSNFNIETDTGFITRVDFEEGIRRTKEWLENEQANI